MDVFVSNDDIAGHLIGDAEDCFAVLQLMANGFDEVADIQTFARRMAKDEHSGSIAARAVAPFLRILAEELEAEEARMGYAK